MKCVKVILKVAMWLAVILVAALLTMPVWFGPVVKVVANAVVPGVVKTDFRLGHLALNPYTARFEFGEMTLDNPSGYSVKEAVKVGTVIFDAETSSLVTDVIHVEEMTVRDIFVSVVSGGENKVLNFKQLQYNVAGGKDKYEAAQSAKEAKSALEGDVTPEAEPKAEGPSKKVVIDKVEISGLKLHFGLLQVPLPALTLKDIGRKTGGCTMEEAWEQVVAAVMKSAGIAGDQLKLFGAITGDATKKANEAVANAAAKAQSVLGEKAKGFSSTATEATGKTIDTANEAVGAGAKKVMDSLKKLW